MAKQVRIADSEHVVRSCKRRLTIRSDGKIVGLFPDAFYLRTAKGETYLSCVYHEFFDPNNGEVMKQCCLSLPYNPDSEDALFKVNVGKVREVGASHQQTLRAMHHLDNRLNPAYASLNGLPLANDVALAQDLCEKSVVLIRKVGDL